MTPDISTLAAAMGAEDLLVFELHEDGASLVGGAGRGAGWAGLVEVEAGNEPHLGEVLDRRRVLRVEGDAASRIIGPYWAVHAALVPVGDHLVVAGSPTRIRASTGELVRHATEAVAVVGDIPASKLLADELELIQAVQQLSEYVPASLAEAAEHAAAVAADALSCEIGVVLLRHENQTHVFGAGAAWASVADDDELCAALHNLATRAVSGPIVEQDLEAVSDNGLRIVSCYALGLGADGLLGALIIGHTDVRPRGFTALCRRVGRALADAAELSILAAMAREEVAAQRDRYALEARTDQLTGLASRVQWEEALSVEEARWQRYGHSVVLISMDLNGLKGVNDRYGHAMGDELLQAAAQIVRGSLRASDVIARIGGDEFGGMLLEADASGAAALRARVEAASATWLGREPDARLSLAIGWAVAEVGETLRDTFARADREMYRSKRALLGNA